MRLPFFFTAALALFPAASGAQNAIFTQVQHGYGVTSYAVGARVAPERVLRQWRSSRLEQDWNVRLARWGAHRANSRARSLWDVAAYPTLRWIAVDRRAPVPFLEGGLGAHLMSRTRIGDRNISTAFQFGEHIAVGMRFGPDGAHALAFRAEHVSNAGIRKPNDGVSFYGIELQYGWR